VKSADGEKLKSIFDVCKEGAVEILSAIGANDTISVITFADDAKPIVRRLSGSDDKSEAETAIRGLKLEGNQTRMDLGLAEALKLLGSPLAKRIRKIVMLTDGKPSSADEAMQQAERIALEEITTSVYGVGKDFNLVLMQTLVTSSNGKCGAVNSPRALADLFKNEFTAAKDVLASNLTLELYYDPEHVRLSEAYRGSPHNAFYGAVSPKPSSGGEKSASLSIGTLEKRHLVEIFVKAEVTALAAARSKWEFLRATVSYDLPGEKRSGLTQNAVLEVDIIDDASQQKTNGDINAAYLIAETQKFQAERNELVGRLRSGRETKAVAAETRAQAIALTKAIKANFAEAGETEAAKIEEIYVKKLMEGGILSDEEITRSGSSSTKPKNLAIVRVPRSVVRNGRK
jgi:hypothetical protein